MSNPQVLGDRLEACLAFLLSDAFVDVPEDTFGYLECLLNVAPVLGHVGVLEDLRSHVSVIDLECT